MQKYKKKILTFSPDHGMKISFLEKKIFEFGDWCEFGSGPPSDILLMIGWTAPDFRRVKERSTF